MKLVAALFTLLASSGVLASTGARQPAPYHSAIPISARQLAEPVVYKPIGGVNAKRDEAAGIDPKVLSSARDLGLIPAVAELGTVAPSSPTPTPAE
ncbi:hypothetical protein EV178_005967 [Coemansia sp. RSA 1646]|nr:hypothetical protein EV178_005967 [Coemansia sp. RSA 1646]